jgi:hypothetical protein
MFPHVFRENGLYVIHFISTHFIHANLPENFYYINCLYFECSIEQNLENLIK